ncbi:MAG: hypothetical protein OIF57_01700 [Marinobacterium sp.]|nr:hypothetical protein [Marinobacterium sp.]
MMIADLVDQDDLCQRLSLLGAPVVAEQDVMQMCETTARWLASADAASCQAVQQLLDELMAQQGLLHPDVLTALQAFLISEPVETRL